MVRVRYVPNQQALDQYYARQTGNGSNEKFYRGPVYQRGHGLGGLFGSIFRAAVPVFRSTVAPALKKGAKALAREALTTGVNVAGDVLRGSNVKESFQQRLPAAANRIRKKGLRKLESMLSTSDGNGTRLVTRKRKGRGGSNKASGKRRRKTIKGRDIFG